jgi:predicted nucleic acid-binding protein
MSEYLLDTNHVSPLVTLEHPLRRRILQQAHTEDNFAICVPVLTEVLFGIGTLPRATKNLAEWRQLRPLFQCYMPDDVDAEVAADLQISLRHIGRQLEVVDALIAAVALRHDLILLTTDKDFRAVPNLRHENWMRS